MTNGIATRQDSDGLRQRLADARIEALYEYAKPAYLTTPVIAGFMIVVLWGAITAEVLVLWFVAVVAVTLARVLLHWRYARTPRDERAGADWENRFVIGALASGCVWAFAPAVLFPYSDPLLQAVMVFVIVGSGLGAVGVYGASMPAFLAFITLPLLATILQLASQPGRSYQLLAMMVGVFMLVALWVFRSIHRGFIERLGARLRNEELAVQLAGSEARMREAIENCPDGIAIFDRDDRLLVCNDGYARVYGSGRDAAQLTGERYQDIARAMYDAELHAGDADPPFEQWLQAREARRRRADGSPRIYQLRDGRWVQGRFGRTRAGGLVSLFSDISELKRAQEAYVGLQAQESLVLETLPVGVAFVRDRVIVRCNGLLERMLGYAPGELAGRPVRDVYASDDYWRQGNDFYDRLAAGGVFEIEGPLRKKDGGKTWVRMQMRAMDPAAPRESAILAFMDITARRQAERKLKGSEAMYRNLVETSNDLVWACDRGARWTFVNGAASQRIYGLEAGELLGREVRERVAPEVADRDTAVFLRVVEGEAVYNYETRHRRRDGTYVDLSFNAVPLRDARGAIIGATGTARDITQQRVAAAALHESVEKLRLAADAADLYYWEWDVDADAFSWGRDPAGLIGGHAPLSAGWPDLRTLVHPEDQERYRESARRALEGDERFHCEFRILTPAGDTRWIVSEGKLMRERDGAARRMIGASRDASQSKRQEEEVRFLAYHDTLTGLPNRRLLDDRLKQAVHLAQRRDGRIGVMLIDLDDFKQVNDTLGHRAGDSVLREVSRRLAACVRKADTLARQGGDEFVVVMPDLAIEADCQVVAEKILRALEPECVVDGRAFRIGASIGISLFPGDAGDGEVLLRNADVAMYRAKQLGRNNYRYYSR